MPVEKIGISFVFYALLEILGRFHIGEESNSML